MDKILSEEEIQLLESVQRRGLKIKLGIGLGLPLLGMVFCFLPSGLLPSRGAQQDDPSESLVDVAGFPTVLLFTVVLAIVLLLVSFLSSSYFKIHKDLKFREKVLHRAKVTELYVHGKNEIGVIFSPKYKGKEGVLFENYKNFPRNVMGREVEIIMTKYALVPLDIKVMD